MVNKVFGVYDDAVKRYVHVFTEERKESAIRHFSKAVNDPKTKLNESPDDYSLHMLASFDDCTGAYDSLPQPEMLSLAKAVKIADLRVAQ